MKAKSPWTIYWVALALLAALPPLGHWLRRTSAPRCVLDGVVIEPLYRVRVVDARGQAHEFCCVTCAKRWLAHQAEPAESIFVTDEASGQEIDAHIAYYVRSLVVTQPITGNRIHVFAHRSDAAKHAEVSYGTILEDDDKPW